MSSETSARLKRNAPSNPPAANGDHRKRRRNRTTQSCLNCHTSKRMCDRKRPACARCTQLGLTGLCVYEVDDPSQRSDSQDENARLLKRVAELEGVIRELKNKPHPRWLQPGSNPGDKWHSRPRLDGGSDIQDSASDAPSPQTSSDSGESPFLGRATKRSNIYPSVSRRPSPSHSQYYQSSPQSTPSPCLMTPTEEHTQPHVAINAPPHAPPDYDLSCIFLAYTGLAGADDYGVLKTGRADETCFIKQHGGHCGCLRESVNYNAVLELSIRLRKAADILARSPSHHIGSTCLLNQRVSDLDTFTTNTLGNIMTPPEDIASINEERSRPNTAALTPNHLYDPTPRRPPARTAAPFSSLQSWDAMPTAPSPSLPCDDSFMSWEPPRRV
ncbi:putative GAL4-like Zn(II)2Cys6 (or C6 zinc) binuclear cluster DNA-binding domain [Lyophyllum shimeji]|uniref:GAL4-like Zn(II)2Cys6 (Or C6 zinc) binuclear cluster DNA-binding domain n=1 Tax=Lyophyllum shimeji TaxID=47721 RepID=A0A9P3UNN1_LYOSH|nr:putative GAL4-like Zn(II)2Cys6 (or C6 zinc) binuclear cluster DNA-binding domain [Lyophyllum shimeji]